MRIGIVNDSIMACEVLRRVVLSRPGYDVVWIARDGAEAIAKAKADRPDLILMDLFMPGTDGVEATRRIMGDSPCAILVVTATVSGHISKVYQAMGYGALDAVDTPVIGLAGEVDGDHPLIRKIEVIGRLTGKAPQPQVAPPAESATPRASPPAIPLVVVGASTGGPFALAKVLSSLPADLDAGLVIVQHVDSTFAPGLGQWLGEQAGRRVELVKQGDRPEPGRILLSGTDDHLVMGPDRRLRYSAEPRSLAYRPSVDVFFSSVARHWPRPGVAVLLTGMGRDGAEGMRTLRRLGWKTIAQDEASSVVWGMPRAAVELDAADQVVPLHLVSGAITGYLTIQDQNRAGAQAPPPSR